MADVNHTSNPEYSLEEGIEEKEEWRPVVGYEGVYEVSSLGNVRSLPRMGLHKGRWGIALMRFHGKPMKINTDRNGYRYLKLASDSTHRHALVHRLVMAAFVGESELQVNHKDGDKCNNRLSNLEYCTSSENLLHASRVLGTRRGDRMPSKIRECDVIKIREDGRKLREIAKDYGVTLQAISLIKNRRNWGWVA